MFQKWNDITGADGPGVSYAEPEAIRLVATLRSLPAPCSNAPLDLALRLAGYGDAPKQVGVTHCVNARRGGATVVAFVQDWSGARPEG